MCASSLTRVVSLPAGPVASWHPFTSIVGLEGLGDDRAFWVSPVEVVGLELARSDLIHEAVHLWAARVGRLGFWLGADGSRLLTRYNENPRERVVVPASTLERLGAVTPLLEGMALYGQLDVDVLTQGDVPGYTPLHVLQDVSWDISYVGATEHAHLEIREWQLAADGNGPGLLTRLFLDPQTDTDHYFAGYWYVKALAAWLAGVIPGLAGRPDALLAVMIKLIVDAPSLTSPDPSLSVEARLDEFHRGLFESGCEIEAHGGLLPVEPCCSLRNLSSEEAA
jgi:hypothetical protein